MSHLVSKSICYTNLLLTTHQKRGVKMLKDVGMSIILDHHGLPGVQTSDQAFAGQCTTNVQFYVRSSFDCEAKALSMLTLPQTPYNYQRALVWTAVMTAVSHLDPDFEAVFSIQAVNEPIMDATLSPGYGDCMRAALIFPVPQTSSYSIPVQRQYVQTLRAVEYILGVGSLESDLDIDVNLSATASNVTAAISATIGGSSILDLEVKKAILASIPILVELSDKLDFKLDFLHSKTRDPLVAK